MKRKKWGAILLAVCMIFTMFPTIALAASGPPDEKKVIENDLIVQLPNSLDAMIDTSPSAWLAVTSEPKWDDGTILDYVKATQEFYDSANNKLTEADTFQDNSRYMMKMTFQSFDSYYGDYYYVLSETNKVYVDFVGVNGQRYPMNVTVDKDANDNPVITATYSFSIGTPPEEPSQEASYEVALLNYGEEYSPENELSTVTVDVNDRSEYNFYLVQTDAEGTRTPVDTSLYDLTFELPSGSQNALVKAYQGQTFYKLSVSGINEAEENLTLTATFKESSESVTKTVPLEVNDTGSYPDFSLAIYGIEYNYRPDRALSNLEEDSPYIVSLVRTKEDGSYSVVDTDLYTIDIQIAKGDTYAFVSDPHKLDDGYAFSIEGKGDTRVSDSVIVHAEGAFGSADLTCPINAQGVPEGATYEWVLSRWDDSADTPLDKVTVVIGQPIKYRAQVIETRPDGTKSPVSTDQMDLQWGYTYAINDIDITVQAYSTSYMFTITGKEPLEYPDGLILYTENVGPDPCVEAYFDFEVLEPTEIESKEKVTITEGLNEVTGNLGDTEYNTIEKIENKLTETIVSNEGYSADNTVLYDIEFVTREDGGETWNPVTAENFPKEGIEVTLPYPDGTNGNEYDFTVVHMFDEDVNGHKAGEVETPEVTEGENGISFRLMGTSPVMIGYKKAAVTHTHSYGKWTDCKDGINHQRSCSCGDVQKEAHAWDSAWVVTTKPTCTEKGKKTRTCTKCGKTETASIPAVGHSFGEYKITKQPTALATGTKTRTCTKCGKTESIAIAKLKPIIALSATKLPLQLKKSTTVLKVTKMQTGDKVASFTSSNSKIVTVHKTSGKLTAKKVGKAIITVKLKSGKSAKCVVTVQKTPVKTTKIQVKPSSLKLKKGKKVKLATVLTPLTSREKVTFTSSNKKIATVSSSGVVTAKKKGKVKITAKSGKKKVTCTITVTAK